MPKYSRTAKYEDLRNRLQSDSEEEVSTRDLNQYERRLHQINASNFQKPEEASEDTAADHDPIHARRSQYLDQAETSAGSAEKKQEDAATAMLKGNENYTSSFNNEFLNEYIKEVKQYNKDHGNSMSTNTDMDILRSLQPDQKNENVTKPYPDEKTDKSEDTKTADIPFYKGANEYSSDFADDDANRPPLSDTRTMTKEDIAAEVQNLIRGQQVGTTGGDTGSITAAVKTAVQQNTGTQNVQPVPTTSSDRTARQQLLNETTQMRAQLDDYEDNLTEVNDKMRHTSHVLNIVLIVLIIALSVVLAVVIYWVLSSRGIIG